jgi:hypothetical protein
MSGLAFAGLQAYAPCLRFLACAGGNFQAKTLLNAPEVLVPVPLNR